jgi:hypothetical protein
MAKSCGCALRFGASVAALLFVGTAARNASALPTISSTSPTNGAIVGDSVVVSATVAAPFVLTSVAAQIGGTSAPMIAAPGKWSVTLDISAEPIAPATMTISATDANGDTATSNVSLVHDHPPSIAVLTPTLSVGRPSLRLRATCTDTDAYGCASVTAAVRRIGDFGAFTTVATTASAALDQTVSLAAFEGVALDIVFTATDVAGATTSATIQGYVESSPNLALVAERDGRVLDVDATRILFVNDTGVYLEDRATGVAVNVGAGTLATETAGQLVSTGAIWTNGDYLNGVSSPRTARFVTARGDWAIRQVDPSTAPVIRQNLTTGAMESLPTGSVYGFGDIDAAGTVAYTSFSAFVYDIHRVPVGGPDEIVIPHDTLNIVSPVHPIIDGTTIVFHARSSFGRSGIAVHSAIGDGFLDTATGQQYGYSLPNVCYRMAGGWIAYNKVVGGSLTAWTRSPAGVEALAGALNDARIIAGVNANGEVAYDVGTGTLARYIGAAGPAGPAKALPIGGANGTMRWFDGAWYELLGRNAFRVDPAGGGDADAGAPDAAAPDASAADAGALDGSAADAGGSSGGSSGSSGSSGSAADAAGSSGASPPDPGSSGGSPGSEPSSGGDEATGGCSAVAGSPAPAGALLVMLGGLAMLGRRRRARR